MYINQCCISTFPIFWGRFFRDAIYKRQNSAQNLCVVFLVLWSSFPPTYVGGDFWCVVLKLSWLWIHRKRKSSIKTRTATRGENFFSILPLFNGKGHMQSGVQHFNITAPLYSCSTHRARVQFQLRGKSFFFAHEFLTEKISEVKNYLLPVFSLNTP